MLPSFPWKALLITLLATAVLTRLGFWQLERADEKEQRQQQLTQRQQVSPLYLHDINRMTSDVRDFPVQIAGHLDSTRLIYWDNRVLEGEVGYEVLAPMMTSNGHVLVNFGWTAAPSSRQRLPSVDLPAESLTLKGVVTQPEPSPLTQTALLESDWPLRVQHPEIKALSDRLETDLMPYIIQVNEPERFGLESNWRPLTMPPEKHLGYAVQWFGLAVAALTVGIIAIRKSRKKNKRNDSDEP